MILNHIIVSNRTETLAVPPATITALQIPQGIVALIESAATHVAVLETDETVVIGDNRTTETVEAVATLAPIVIPEVATTTITVEPETITDPVETVNFLASRVMATETVNPLGSRAMPTETAHDPINIDYSITATVMDGSRSNGSRSKAIETIYPDTPSVLLDSGASLNYITYATCKRLNISLLPSKGLVVKSVHGHSKCKHCVT